MKKNLFLILAAILCCSLWVTSCSNQDDPVTPTDEVESQLAKMTLREKVGQMFYVRMETLDTTIHWSTYAELQENPVLEVNQTMRDVNERYPVGGLILYAWNIDTESQLATLISQIRSLNGQPLLCIDEEGGRVSRIANNPNFDVKKYESMSAIGATGDPANAYECGNTIGTYLHRYGFDIDFAPVADVNTNPENVIIGARAFSDDPAVAAPMVTNYLQGLKDAGVTGCIKHFPGHGDTKADTHFGYASTQKTWAEMMDCEMVTFKAGIQWGCQLIMTAHIGTPKITGSDVPSTMSPIILQDKLRGELGYQNIIITDGMEMGAITQQYTSAEAAVGSIQAGVDIVLGPKNLIEAFDAVIAAVNDGTISEERINQSVRRILKLKMK
ncbi:MAG: glycoside hydrolase family 3 protein [Prevotella sp.]|nr:glycoside hydrolase family 3 protein [Prevotella sp.]